MERDNKEINFTELVDFIDREARIAKHPVFSPEAILEAEGRIKQSENRFQLAVGRPSSSKSKSVLATMTNTVVEEATATEKVATTIVDLSDKRQQTCPGCSKSRDLDECSNYLSQSVEDRRKFLIKNLLCFACYGHTSKNHDARTCRRRRKCKICNKLHPSGLHAYRPAQHQKLEDSTTAAAAPASRVESAETELKAVKSCVTDVTDENIAVSIVMVRLTTTFDPQREIVVYAALDSMSTACFILSDVWRKLGSPGEETEITVKTMADESKHTTAVVKGLCVTAMSSNKPIHLPKTYTQEVLPIDLQEAPSHAMIMKYRHLVSEMPDRDRSIPVGLLIGANCSKALEPHQVIRSVNDGPFAVKTALGWCILGPVQKATHIIILAECYRVAVQRQLNMKFDYQKPG